MNLYSYKGGAKIETLFEEKSDKWVEPIGPAKFISSNNLNIT